MNGEKEIGEEIRMDRIMEKKRNEDVRKGK